MMQKMNDIGEAVLYLKEGDVLTSNAHDMFVMKNEKIHVYNDGTHYSLDLEDFMKLYKTSSLYLYEESVEIDEEKDEAYYRYYRK